MRVGLHDADMEHLNTKRRQKTFPNYALMKISAYHKLLGDTVEWWLPNGVYDRVYSSKVFSFTPENPYLPADVIKGGTGYGLFSALPPEIDDMFPDYSLYPACDYGIKQLESLIDSGYRIDLNQGMDARLVTDDIAQILSKLKWIKYLRFSCDTTAQIEYIQKTAEMLGKRGIKPYRLFIYLLVTEDLDNAEYRVEQLKKLRGITIYAQAERKLDGESKPNALQMEFCQRYVYSGKFRSVSWSEYAKERGLIT